MASRHRELHVLTQRHEGAHHDWETGRVRRAGAGRDAGGRSWKGKLGSYYLGHLDDTSCFSRNNDGSSPCVLGFRMKPTGFINDALSCH